MISGVLVAHDFTERSGAVTAAAADLAGRLGLEVTVVYAIPSDELEKERQSRHPDSAFSDVVIEQLRAQLSRIAATEFSNMPDVDFHVEVVEGDPDFVIHEYMVRQQPEFTFIGMRSRSRVGKLLFGSVPQAILLGGAGKVVAVPTGH